MVNESQKLMFMISMQVTWAWSDKHWAGAENDWRTVH